MEGLDPNMTVTHPADAPVEDPGGRVRWGVSGNLGWHFPSSAFTFGIDGRVGFQISNLFSAYAIFGAGAGFGFGGGTQGVSATALTYIYLGGIAELMFADLFFVGAGPVLAQGAYVGGEVGLSSAGISQTIGVSSVGIKPGLDLRLGIQLGKTNQETHRRGGFSIGLDVLTLMHLDSTITTTRRDGPGGTTGTPIVRTGQLGVSVIPMLMLGYDAR